MAIDILPKWGADEQHNSGAMTGLRLVFGTVYMDASDFNNPEFARDEFSLQCFGECGNSSKQFGVAGTTGQTNNSDAGIISGPEAQRIREIEVEGNEAP
ncbi:MAG TPA: hypothetical protein VGJ48_21870 [Pyrinomonadaceae bacterium]|jgi:hypothetical protein